MAHGYPVHLKISSGECNLPRGMWVALISYCTCFTQKRNNRFWIVPLAISNFWHTNIHLIIGFCIDSNSTANIVNSEHLIIPPKYVSNFLCFSVWRGLGREHIFSKSNTIITPWPRPQWYQNFTFVDSWTILDIYPQIPRHYQACSLLIKSKYLIAQAYKCMLCYNLDNHLGKEHFMCLPESFI